MREINDGGPAFPLAVPAEFQFAEVGMSLRDWFAGQALASAVEDYGEPTHQTTKGQRTDRGNPVLPWATTAIGSREDIIARQAYRYADAMLAARQRAEAQDA